MTFSVIGEGYRFVSGIVDAADASSDVTTVIFLVVLVDVLSEVYYNIDSWVIGDRFVGIEVTECII